MHRPLGLRKSRDSNSSMMRFKGFLRVVLFSLHCFDFATFPRLMDPNMLRKCAQRLVETADFIRNTNWIAK